VTVREYSNDDLKNTRSAGLNRTYWDLRYHPIAASASPFVLPGDYRVTLIVDGHSVGSQTVRVIGDPLAKITDADRKLQHDTALALHKLQGTSIEAATTVTMASGQVRELQDALKRIVNAPATLSSSADALSERLTRLNGQFGVGRQLGGPDGPSIGTRITNLKNQIIGWTAAPTPAQSAQAQDARVQLGKLVDELNDITSKAIPALFKGLSDNNAHPVELKPISPVKIAP
jgi:hypothetical protein